MGYIQSRDLKGIRMDKKVIKVAEKGVKEVAREMTEQVEEDASYPSIIARELLDGKVEELTEGEVERMAKEVADKVAFSLMPDVGRELTDYLRYWIRENCSKDSIP